MYGKSREKPFVAKFDKLHESLDLASVAAEDCKLQTPHVCLRLTT